MRTPATGRRPRHGGVVLEMGIVGPVALYLLIGIMDVGVAVHSNNVLAEAAREGARYAVVHGSLSTQAAGPTANDTAVEQATRKYAFGLLPGNLTVRTNWPDGNNKPQSRVTVQVSYTYTPASLFGNGTLQFNGSSTMLISH